MAQAVVLTSLGELGRYRDRFAEDTRPVPDGRALVPVIGASGPDELEALAATARRALEDLRAVASADAEQRQQAGQALGRWRRLQAEAERVRRIASEMSEAARQAQSLAVSAFEPPAARRAEGVAATAGRLATQAGAHATALQREADALAARDDIARLVEQEDRLREEEEMRESLALAGRYLDGGRYEEARRLLNPLAGAISRMPSLIETFETLRRREQAVKMRTAEAALREARRLHRREPVQAIDHIETLDLAALPEDLVRHLYGCWLAACRRIGLVAAVHYRSGFGRGAVLIPTEDGRWEVVTALGLQRWPRGRRFEPQALRGVRPLA